MLWLKLQRKQSKSVFFPTAYSPATRWEKCRCERPVTLFAASQQSLMVAPMSCRLYCKVISSIPYEKLSCPRRAYRPSATFVSARPRSHRLRYDFCFTGLRLFACQRKNLHCATCLLRSPGRPSLVALAANSLRYIRFLASGFFTTAMKYCSRDRLCCR